MGALLIVALLLKYNLECENRRRSNLTPEQRLQELNMYGQAAGDGVVSK